MEACPPSFLPAVDLLRCFQLRLGGFEGITGALDRPEEAGLVAFVTGRADLLDLQEQRVPVAIEREVLHRLGVAALLALHPELLPGAAQKWVLPVAIVFSNEARF